MLTLILLQYIVVIKLYNTIYRVVVDVWNQLEELLKSKNITRYKLSKLTGIGQTTLQSYKDGVEPSFKNMCKIADALDVSLDYFRKDDGK